MFEDIASYLNAAGKLSLSSAAKNLSHEAQQQIKRNFKSTAGFGSVKTYDLKSSSVVSIKPSFLSAFAEGKTLRGKSTLIVLLPDGERLGFKRISKNNTWASVWQKIHNRAHLVGVGDGIVVVYSYRGKNYAIYKFQKSVTVPKLISLGAKAEAITGEISTSINQLLDNYEQR